MPRETDAGEPTSRASSASLPPVAGSGWRLETTHTFRYGRSESRQALESIETASVDLVVTSPPYPMIAMWDRLFAAADPAIADALAAEDAPRAFELMHRWLQPVWREIHRVLRPGGIACINVGDAVRSVGGEFALFSNHARVLEDCLQLGFVALPSLLWRKPTNAPNKFMGSGMLPAGAYVTLEHEHILVLRKGGKRRFEGEAAALRRRSAYFWEERNRWFNDHWELCGTRQRMDGPTERDRSAAFPLLVPYRLILMFSIYGDLVLDPFSGVGTTGLAALAAGRNSVGLDIDPSLMAEVEAAMSRARERANALAETRLAAHEEFVAEAERRGRHLRHCNSPHGFRVMTSQEQDMEILGVQRIECLSAGVYRAYHERASAVRFAQGELL